jgi:hypothetical protein
MALDRPGVETMLLFTDSCEEVRLERWAPGALITLDLSRGGEFFVLAGEFHDGGEYFEPQSWLRIPVGQTLHATAGRDGCKVWVKTGGRNPESPANPASPDPHT